jgi:oligosaccharide repeat unit polymerase
MSLLVVLALASLQWSSYYRDLSFETLFFLLSLFSVNVLISVFFNFDNSIKVSQKQQSQKLRLLLYFLYIINVLYSKEIALLNVVLGVGSYYKDIANIPTLFPIVISLNVFLIIDLFVRINNGRKAKNIMTLVLLFSFLILNMGRGIALMAALTCLFSYFIRYKFSSISFKKSFKILLSFSIVMILFSIMGSVRSDSNEVRNQGNIKLLRSFTELVQPTQHFYNSGVSEMVLWPYVYAISPIYNFDNAVKTNYNLNDCNVRFLTSSLLSESIQKNLLDKPNENKTGALVNYIFNVSTTFLSPFYYCGWLGVVFYLIAFYGIFFFLYFIVRNTEYKIVFLGLYSTIFSLSLFSNMFILDVLFIPVIGTVLLSLIGKKKIKIGTTKISGYK